MPATHRLDSLESREGKGREKEKEGMKEKIRKKRNRRWNKLK